jgi:predicted NBD/HSP70 family sugar kinase
MILGIDIGGTKTWIGRFKNNSLLKSRKFQTEKDPKKFLNDLVLLIQEFLGEDLKKLKGIGIGAPGPLDIENGIFNALPNLPAWKGFHLESALEEAYHVPVLIQNDANAAALGEALYGGGRDSSSLYYITMSTGIGGGYVVDGRIVNGKNNLTGEIWALPVMNMGRPDILINSASGPGIVKNYLGYINGNGSLKKTTPARVTPEDILHAAEAGDTESGTVIRNAVECMAGIVLAILHTVDPHIVLFGGGLTAGKSYIIERIREAVRKKIFFKKHANTPIKRASLWDDAVLYGGVSLFKK